MDERTAVHALDMPCPSCHGLMQVRALACRQCDLHIEGSFKGNEFADLPAEHLQLLRVFVHCEGRIRDMEKVLGVSYPTVKNRIAAMRTQLGLHSAVSAVADASELPAAMLRPDSTEANALAVLDALERGEIDHARAVADLQAAAELREPER